MKRVPKPVFIILAVLILSLSYFSVFGLHITSATATTEDQTTSSTASEETVSSEATTSDATATESTASKKSSSKKSTKKTSSKKSSSTKTSSKKTSSKESSKKSSSSTASSETVSSDTSVATSTDTSSEATDTTTAETTTTTYIKGIQDIRWGIDIRGGIEATFCPADDSVQATAAQVESVKSIIEMRLVENNITDYEVYADQSNGKVIVRFPWKETETEFNPEEAIEELAATAMLTFRSGAKYANTTTTENGEIQYTTPKGKTAKTVLLNGNDIASASAEITTDEDTKQKTYQVALTFTDEGATKFENATADLVGKQMSIWMDDVMISAPTVNEKISGGQAVISGDFTSAEATKLANKINAGALPFSLKVSNYSTISPTLGSSALEAMGLAGVIALILILLFMLIRYRVPGLVACLALLGQLGISLACVSGFFPFISSFTMTLPGIAGIILSIGMGADANIIMAERVREEFRSGKTLDSAIQAGSKNSFTAIFDGNVTVIIVAIILLLVFGPSNILSALFGTSTTGTVYSFGYTLLVGVISNFVMGVAASRLMLKSISGFKFLRKKSFYGGAKE